MGLFSSITNVVKGLTGQSNVSSGYGAARGQISAALPEAKQFITESRDQAIQGLQPYAQQGQQAVTSLADLMANPNAITQTPQYQFQMQEGLRGISQSNSALGKFLSGQTLRDITKFGQGLASTSYQQQFGNLFNLSQLGQGAATQAGQFQMGAGQNLANLVTGMAENQASLAASEGRDIGGMKMGLFKDVMGAATKGIGGGG